MLKPHRMPPQPKRRPQQPNSVAALPDPPVDPFDLPVELRRRRKARGWSQAKVGAAIGYSGAIVGQWERGDLDPHWTTVLRWALVLGLDVTVQEQEQEQEQGVPDG